MPTIRRGYRYVVAYQRRLLDCVAALNEQIGAMGYEQDGWKPLYYGSPSTKKLAAAHWAWDFSPLYATRFFWTLKGRKANESGASCFILDHVVDTAFETRSQKGGQPDPLEDLTPVEASDSVLRARWFHIMSPLPAAIWELEWDSLVPKFFACPIDEVWPLLPTERPSSRTKDGIVAGGHVVALSTLADPGDFDRTFVAPILDELRRTRQL